jgi:hypothetical protein
MARERVNSLLKILQQHLIQVVSQLNGEASVALAY